MDAFVPVLADSLSELRRWMDARQYAGHEPYDALNSPYLEKLAAWGPAGFGMIQLGKHCGGLWLRRALRIPASQNPKGLGLALAAYCDLARCGQDCRREAAWLAARLEALRSPGEKECCWGYDWHYSNVRGHVLPKFSPNCIATYFCASALLQAADQFGMRDAAEMAESAGRFITTRLNRSIDTGEHLCFSYTPETRTVIYNNSVLAAELLARLGVRSGNREYLSLARRAMNYLAHVQSPAGAWKYGGLRSQGWVDSFHTGYNLTALLSYGQITGDHSFDEHLARGYRYYLDTFFEPGGAPRYFQNSLYPIDIHCCSQAVLTFCAFTPLDLKALALACSVGRWTIANMRSPEGLFYYQKRRFWTDRTPYMRWGQAWMFLAMARLLRTIGA